MKTQRYLTALFAPLLFAANGFASDSAPQFKVTPTGRILMDAAVYMGGNKGIKKLGEEGWDKKFVNGAAIPDIRLGAKVSYGKWKAKIDVGFSYGKVGLKDTYVEYDFNESNLLRGGYFVPQWGLNSETSSSMKPSYEEPTSNEFFNANPRFLALMWVYDKGHFYQGTSLFTEAAAMTNNASDLGKESWGVETRLVYRSADRGSQVFQVGTSLHYSTPTSDDHTGFVFNANFPTRESKVMNLFATVTDAKGLFKISPELLLIKDRFAFESQYYYMDVIRKNGFRNYQAHGAYGMARFILKGDDYSYSHSACGMATPAPKSLELVTGYNWTKANDRKAGVMGGITNDANVTLNYYINQWMIARLRYSYSNVYDRYVEGLTPKRHVNTIEARFQIIF